jgi:hypothetical protein
LNCAEDFLTSAHDETRNLMPTLNWHKRDEAVRAATRAPYRLLEPVAELSSGDADSENLLIQGDNLDALKALESQPGLVRLRVNRQLDHPGYLSRRRLIRAQWDRMPISWRLPRTALNVRRSCRPTATSLPFPRQAISRGVQGREGRPTAPVRSCLRRYWTA